MNACFYELFRPFLLQYEFHSSHPLIPSVLAALTGCGSDVLAAYFTHITL
jgi:hypothetical protein